MISLFNQDNGMVLKLKLFENKKHSEIHQVQDCIKDCQFKNTVFTMDSLHCHKKTPELITEKNNDYLIAVKKNQSTLYKQIEQVSNNCKPIDVFYEKDQSRKKY